MITIVKAKPLPNGFWYSTKWDILRTLRDSENFLVAVKENDTADPSIMTKEELFKNAGTEFKIKDEEFSAEPAEPTWKLTPINKDITT